MSFSTRKIGTKYVRSNSTSPSARKGFKFQPLIITKYISNHNSALYNTKNPALKRKRNLKYLEFT